MDSLARLMLSNENAHTIQPSKNAAIDLQTPRKGVLFAFKDVTNNKASSSGTFDNLKSAKKSTPFGNKLNKPSTPDLLFSLGPASPNLVNIRPSSSKFDSKLSPEIDKSVNTILSEDIYADPDEFNFPKNGDCACCGSNRKNFEDQIYDDFVERMLAAPMFPTVEREIFSPDPISELEYVSIESEEFPFSSPIAIPVPNYQPTIQPFNFDSHSVGSNEYEHESDFDETASNNESNYSMADFDLNFSEICINPGANEGFMDDQYEIFSDNEANNSMPEFKLNFTDDSINPEASVGLDSSFTGEW